MQHEFLDNNFWKNFAEKTRQRLILPDACAKNVNMKIGLLKCRSEIGLPKKAEGKKMGHNRVKH